MPRWARIVLVGVGLLLVPVPPLTTIAGVAVLTVGVGMLLLR